MLTHQLPIFQPELITHLLPCCSRSWPASLSEQSNSTAGMSTFEMNHGGQSSWNTACILQLGMNLLTAIVSPLWNVPS